VFLRFLDKNKKALYPLRKYYFTAMRRFNVTGLCVPSLHYMADTGDKISRIMQFVERGDYFSINRGRQYGKTTTLSLLEKALPAEYTVISISFEGSGDGIFEDEPNFCQMLLRLCARDLSRQKLSDAEVWNNESITNFFALSQFITEVCKNKKIVLMIDEVDKLSNNFVFLRFLGLLREKYLLRQEGRDDSFHTVILVGVHDVKNLKNKMVQAGTHQLQGGETRILSPWNIAINFNVDMSLNVKEIASMLAEYENDHKTGMDIEAVAKEIRDYTSGYPYLVSRICQYIEEESGRDWTLTGVLEATNQILVEQSTLFDDLFKNIENNPDLKDLLRRLTVGNRACSYNIDNRAIQLAVTFGIVGRKGHLAAIHNRIFEVRIMNYFISEKETEINKIMPDSLIRSVTGQGHFDMPLFLEKFANHYYEIYNNKDINFLERECRLLFITYLKPYMNGGGFYHLESETRDGARTDVIIDYNAEQFIVELKLWYGEVAHEEAYEQLSGYLDSKNRDVGYLLTFDFRKEKNIGKPQFGWVEHSGKKIFDVMVGF
jgi:hypothetical protein